MAVLTDATIPLLDQLPVEHLFDMSVELEPAQAIATPRGARMTFIARGGVVDGPRLRGELLPGGGDWLLVGGDAVGLMDVRATIRAEDSTLIHFTNRGIIEVPADGLARLAAGERLTWGETYIRSTPMFETGEGPHEWLNRTVAVAMSELGPNRVDYRIYRVA